MLYTVRQWWLPRPQHYFSCNLRIGTESQKSSVSIFSFPHMCILINMHADTYMKSVVTRWEPLAMALNSTPSRSMSLGRHHSSMFPTTPTSPRGNIKTHTGKQTSCDTRPADAWILSPFRFTLMKQQWHQPDRIPWNFIICVGWVLTLKWQLSK